MIRKILLPAFFILLANVVFAQRFDAGILVGLNGSQVNGDTYRGYYKPGILAGAFVQTDIAPALFAGMEIKYSQKGARNKINQKDPDPTKYIMRLDYIDVPFFVGFRTNDKGTILGGISAGYLMHAAEYDEYGLFPPEDTHAFNSLDLQPFLGFQFDMLDDLKIDLRFAYSVLPIRGNPENDLWYWRQNQFNNVISLALYYQFSR